MVMRDGDVREQTPIQSVTSKGGLLGTLGALQHHRSLCWAVMERLEEEEERKEGDCPMQVTNFTLPYVYYFGDFNLSQ